MFVRVFDLLKTWKGLESISEWYSLYIGEDLSINFIYVGYSFFINYYYIFC